MKARIREIIECNTVVIGSGASGYNTADWLWDNNQKDVVIVTENRLWGTSRNAGSDKQTYYKLSLSGAEGDSPLQLAQTLFSGGAMDGDLALCEASLSALAFSKLVMLGVPFPKNRYGEYVGYKTDHDPYTRGTSVGPHTSKVMTEKLEESVINKGISIRDRLLAVKLLVADNAVQGLLCLDLTALERNVVEFIHFRATNVVFATGGPGGIYKNSVYPTVHYGGSGIAFAEGVKARNLTEWQYGLASTKPRWNVSGSYMQVLPRFVSTDTSGNDEREFLNEYFTDEATLLNKIFLKGYQWPFDVQKVADGSSIIDILVFLEQRQGRRVYLDYTKNPFGKSDLQFENLPQESREYLQKAGICFGTPFARLEKLNQPAIDLYSDKGVDIEHQWLEIALCAQHNNGGLAVNLWWETNIAGVFSVGEAAGTHGITRPGGSALNSGQTGSLRAAEYISRHRRQKPKEHLLESKILQDELAFLSTIKINPRGNVNEILEKVITEMSKSGAAFRVKEDMIALRDSVVMLLNELPNIVVTDSIQNIETLYRLRSILQSQRLYLEAFINYASVHGESRGSAIYYNEKGSIAYNFLPESFRFLLSEGVANTVQEICSNGNEVEISWRVVNPIPVEENFFETVWTNFRENRNIF